MWAKVPHILWPCQVFLRDWIRGAVPALDLSWARRAVPCLAKGVVDKLQLVDPGGGVWSKYGGLLLCLLVLLVLLVLLDLLVANSHWLDWISDWSVGSVEWPLQRIGESGQNAQEGKRCFHVSRWCRCVRLMEVNVSANNG